MAPHTALVVVVHASNKALYCTSICMYTEPTDLLIWTEAGWLGPTAAAGGGGGGGGGDSGLGGGGDCSL